MIDDWRKIDGKTHERQICLTCFIMNKYEMSVDIYEFCAYYIQNGMFGDRLPTTEEEMKEKLKTLGSNLFDCVKEDLFREYDRWKQTRN